MFFFFNDTATTEIYTLSLHDALPILVVCLAGAVERAEPWGVWGGEIFEQDRKSTRLNSSHANISYAAFCLKKKETRSRRACLTAPFESPVAAGEILRLLDATCSLWWC